MPCKKCDGTGWVSFRSRWGREVEACDCQSEGICPLCQEELLGNDYYPVCEHCGWDSEEGERKVLAG